jgi:hypothetical protein
MRLGAGGLDDAFVERLLFLSAQHARLLSDVRKMRVRAALLAENLRLAKTPAPLDAPVFVEHARRRETLRIASERVKMPGIFQALAFSAAAALAVGAYAWLGGTPGQTSATIDGQATIQRQRTGAFGLTWRIPDSQSAHRAAAAGVGDRITANSVLTLTYPDGSTTVVERGAQLQIEANGVALQRGALEARVTPRGANQARYEINSSAGTLIVKGTVLRAQAVEGGALLVQTIEGLVAARNDVREVNIGAGEQTLLRKGDAPVVDLQIPRIALPGNSNRRLLTNQRGVPFSARIVPNGALMAIDQNGREVARFTADADGVIRTELTADERRPLRLRFLQEYANGSARSNLSEAVEIVYDQAAPALQVNAYNRTGDKITISGRARANDALTINGTAVTPDADGAFSLTLILPAQKSDIEILSRDAAGNVVRVVQSVAR